MKKKLALAMAFLCLSIGVFAQRKVEVVEKVKVDTNAPAGKVIKRKVAIGRFSNETQYGKGLFYDKENDPMGKQALDILSSKLATSGNFCRTFCLIRVNYQARSHIYQSNSNGSVNGLRFSIGENALLSHVLSTEFGNRTDN